MANVCRWVWESIRTAGWAPVAVLAVHAAAKLLGLYGALPQVDVPMHFFGGIAIAFFFWRSFRLDSARRAIGAMTPLGQALMTTTAVISTVLIWEFAEWILRSTRSPNHIRVSDTMLDMVIGAIGGALLLAWSLRQRSTDRAIA